MATRALERTLLLEEEILTSAPPARRRWRRAPVVALAVLMALVAAETAARALAPHVPVPSGWSHQQTAVVVERMRTVAATEGGADVVFLGSSVASFGFEPAIVRSETGLRAFNAGLVGASAVSVERWTSEFVIPRLRPKVAVIGLISRDLNFGGMQRRYFETYLDSPGRKRELGIESAAERIERAAADRSALVRLRQYLRKPGSVVKHLRGTGALEEVHEIGPHGERLSRTVSYPHRWNYDALEGFSMEENVAALARMVNELRENGTRVVFVEAPVVEETYVPFHPRGREDFDAFRAALRTTAENLDVPLIRPSGRWETARWFVDAAHLNQAGARRLTTQVARDLRQLGIV